MMYCFNMGDMCVCVCAGAYALAANFPRQPRSRSHSAHNAHTFVRQRGSDRKDD